MVKDLIVDGKWQLEDIVNWISVEEANAICAIPISVRRNKDKLQWVHNENGKYSVRSGHFLACKEPLKSFDTPSNSRTTSPDLWKALWKLKVPPNVRIFLWKACNSAVSTKENLFKRKCSSTAICPVCLEKVESVEHVLILCQWAKVTWFSSFLSIRIEETGFTSFSDWCWR